MSKRRISHQQSLRIEKQHTQYRETTDENLIREEGLVITRYSRHVLIEAATGQRVLCSIRPSIDSLVSGDRVIWLMEGQGQGVVISRFPRDTVLGRPDKKGAIKPVAANITQVVVVVAPKPEISWPLLDSYLVMAEYLKLNASIVLNKVDLQCSDLQKQLSEEYETLGYPILFTSAGNDQHFNDFLHQLDHQTSVFVGQSGVGKSSLIVRVLPTDHKIQVGAISKGSDLGRHTTTNSCFYHLPTGGALIDSPGVREFGLWHMEANDIAKGYREFQPYLLQCKFRNCNHLDAPGCSLIEAVKNGIISTKRYNNYVKISSQFAK
jgi:ribosome biogenesis GTPase